MLLALMGLQIHPPCLGSREEGDLSAAVVTFKSNYSDTASALFLTVFPSFFILKSSFEA